MKGVLSKAHKLIVRYAVFASPITLFYIYWFTKHVQEPPQTGFLGRLNYFAFAWILSLLYVVLALLFNGEFRESVLARLAGFKEGDEREQLVTARSARATFLLMLAVQVVMLVMTLTKVHLTLERRTSPDDKPGILTVGLAAGSENLDVYPSVPSNEESNPKALWDWGGRVLPANLTLPMLLLVLLQLGAFRLFSGRRYEGLDG